ncbi:DISARM system SNF2-like helicase DrmD [Shewanella algae]|uniref:DISARM system SNF2-like helicase DrmD n=1 Tax=Shewanella algae TaxID=38313 RepID=UPI0031F4D77A
MHQEQSDQYLPEPGQLVEVRNRRWVVKERQLSSLHGSSIGQNLLSLDAIDEDMLGDELQVIWELEPGARVIERAGLPDWTGFDRPEELEAFLNAVKWGAATNADRTFLQAPFRSGVSIESFQLDPVVRAIDMARVNLLIADDVGLGKTIEAGLVVQELLLRHRARSVLIVCPASLQEKWRIEMSEKFGLDFRILDTNYIKDLRRKRGIHVNPWTSYPRLIVSMDWMKTGDPLRLLKDALPPEATYPRKFDMLIVDEAHNVAPSGVGNYVSESLRTKAIRLISPHFEHKLFLSATPHNGYPESFSALLELLDNQRFARDVKPSQKQLEQVMVRRLKSQLVDENGERIYPIRELKALRVPYSAEEQEAHKLLHDYAESLSASAEGTSRKFGTEFVLKLLKKRLFSSPAAFATTLAKHRDTLENGKSSFNDKKISERILRTAIARSVEDYANDESFEQAIDEAVQQASSTSFDITADQKRLLQKLTKWAEAEKNRADSKALALFQWIDSHLKENGDWNGKRVILFTEYRATHAWLEQLLVSHGYGGERLSCIHGGMDEDEREKVKNAFQAHPDDAPVRILLATDAASEGIDLQNHCNYLIHIEIPWNPNVMEQRNGRVDRHGQKESKVLIWHPVGVENDYNNGDHEYLLKAAQKVEAIREDLGSVGPVIAQQIEEAMLGKRTVLDTAHVEVIAKKTSRALVAERNIAEKTRRLAGKFDEAKNDFNLSPEHILHAVQTGLRLADKPLLIPLSGSLLPEGKVFQMPSLPGAWKECEEGLNHPFTGIRRPITFDHDVAKGRDDIVLVHLNHKLVRMCLRLLRESIWDPRSKLHRMALLTAPDSIVGSPVFITLSRLVITGGNHQRLHEEIITSATQLTANGTRRIRTVGETNAILEAVKACEELTQPPESVHSAYQQYQDDLLAHTERRSQERLANLISTLKKREEQEQTNIAQVMDELAKSISAELSEHQPEQLSLLAPEQQQLRKRTLSAIEARAKQLPHEKQKEMREIQRRYSNPVSRTFPVAVMVVMPESLLEGGAE